MDEALHRLSRKPGVKGWIMLDRSTGAVIKTNGQISAIRPAQSPSAANGSNPNNNNNNGSGSNGNTTSALPTPTAASFSTDVAANVDAEAQAAHELGSMVYGFMSTAGSLVQEMDTEVWPSSRVNEATVRAVLTKIPYRTN